MGSSRPAKARSHGKPTVAGAESSPDFHLPRRALDQVAAKASPAEPEPPATLGRMIPAPFSTPPAAPGRRNRRCTCIATSVRVFRNAHHSWRWDPDNEVPVDMAVFPAFLFIPISAGGTMVVPPIDFARQSPAQVDSAALIQVINDCKVGSFSPPVLIENLARKRWRAT